MGRVELKSASTQLVEVAETLTKAREQLAEHPLAELWLSLLEHTENEIRHEAEKEAQLAKEEGESNGGEAL